MGDQNEIEDDDRERLGITLSWSRPNGARGYSFTRIRDVQVFAHGRHRLLVHASVDGNVNWALLGWCTGGDGKDETEEGCVYEVVMYGYGYSGLREARHTYFGRAGHIYYVNPSLLAWAFGVLREWFDFDGDERKDGA